MSPYALFADIFREKGIASGRIALMQRANDVTIETYKATVAMLREGMTKADFTRDSVAAFAALGVEGRQECAHHR